MDSATRGNLIYRDSSSAGGYEVMSHLNILLRSIVRQKGYSLINVFGLALGIAVCSLIFLWIQDELGYDHYHQNLDDIYQVVLNAEGEWWTSSNWALSPILKQDYPEI